QALTTAEVKHAFAVADQLVAQHADEQGVAAHLALCPFACHVAYRPVARGGKRKELSGGGRFHVGRRCNWAMQRGSAKEALRSSRCRSVRYYCSLAVVMREQYMDITEIHRFAAIEDKLVTAGQPKEACLAAIGDAGFET